MIRRLALLAVLFSLSLSAEPITYILSGTATGTLGTNVFTDAPFVWTGVGDTTTTPVVIPGAETLFTLTSSYIGITGMPLATFPIDATNFVAIGLIDPSLLPDTAALGAGWGASIVFSAEALGTWDGISALSPTLVTLNFIGGGFPTPTDQGDLDITAVSEILQFEADTGSVPEPATWTLLALAAAGLCRSARSRLKG
jgi:hypothetical protein